MLVPLDGSKKIVEWKTVDPNQVLHCFASDLGLQFAEICVAQYKE